MKESGMDKLIELLNEYELKGRNWKGGSWIESDKDVFLKQEYIIGKRYGFIKWLVDNDKIVLGKVKNIKLPIDTKLRARVDEDEKKCFDRLYTLKLLMLLSISDTPIDFLTKIIK